MTTIKKIINNILDLRNSAFVKKHFIFGNFFLPIRKNHVNLFYWRYLFTQNNVGDLLSSVIYNFITDDLGLDKNKRISQTKKIGIIGSIIQILPKDTIIWGSGSLTDYLDVPKLEYFFDVRAVRGPLTQKLMKKKGIKCPEIYGDPAILLPLFYNPIIEKVSSRTSYIIVPHYSKYAMYKGKYDNVLSTLTNDWRGFVDMILSTKLVIASSLHAIILAESYGVPAIFLDERIESIFKYDDYYMSTLRFPYKKANSIEEAFKQCPEKLPANLDKLRYDLCHSFPVELFEEEGKEKVVDIKSRVIYNFLSKYNSVQ